MSDINEITIGDRYQIQQKLSHKAGRQTWLALDRVTQEQVIIKILQFDSLFQWDDLKLFEREAKTLKNINHPAIPKYIDYFEIDNEIRGFALVQTYIDAPSLEDAIHQGRKFTEAELIELAQKLLTILEYLHSFNPPVIHRDIKPSNILLSNRTGNSVGNLSLVDFGSVQTAASRGEGTITIVGSYGYIPLEQFGGQTTTASDLYSLGMTLIYLVTGVHPAELPQNNGRIKFDRSQISNGLQRWLTKMTQPYLDKRFDSAKSALVNLLAKEKSSNSFPDIKPHNTNIKLHRYGHKLEIRFEREVINYESQEQDIACFCLILLIAASIFVLALQLPAPLWFLYLLITTCLWIKVFGKNSLYNYSKTHYEAISIDTKRLIKWAKYRNKNQRDKQLKWHSKNSIERVELITYNPGYVFYNLTTSKGKIPYQLSLHTNKEQYIVGNGQQSKMELLWLGKEISYFLDLELIIYQDPRMPDKEIEAFNTQSKNYYIDNNIFL